jgi:hypothetical protein
MKHALLFQASEKLAAQINGSKPHRSRCGTFKSAPCQVPKPPSRIRPNRRIDIFSYLGLPQPHEQKPVCRGPRIRPNPRSAEYLLGIVAPMKIYPWLLTLAFGAVSFTGWALSSLVLRSLSDIGYEHLPAVTMLVLRPNAWILFCPVPWIIYSVILSLRRETTPSSLFIFTGTVLLAVAVLVCALMIASVVPWLPMKVGLSK